MSDSTTRKPHPLGRPVTQDRIVFARNFWAARKAARLSQQAIHDQTGIATGFISKVERGRVSVGIDVASQLAEAVGQPLWKLLKL